MQLIVGITIGIAAVAGLIVLIIRADTRIKKREMLILEILRDGKSGGQFGLEIVERSAGRVKRGSVYVYLSQLEDEGYVRSWPVDDVLVEGQIRRNLYQITDAGLDYLASQTFQTKRG